jgi:hypothetical protein
VQRGGPINLRGVHVNARLQQRADAGAIALFGGIGKCRAFRGKCRNREAERQKHERENLLTGGLRVICKALPVHARLL